MKGVIICVLVCITHHTIPLPGSPREREMSVFPRRTQTAGGCPSDPAPRFRTGSRESPSVLAFKTGFRRERGRRPLPPFSPRVVERGRGAGVGLRRGLSDAPSAGQKGRCRAASLPSRVRLGGRPHGTMPFAARQLCRCYFRCSRVGTGLGTSDGSPAPAPPAHGCGPGALRVSALVSEFLPASSLVPSQRLFGCMRSLRVIPRQSRGARLLPCKILSLEVSEQTPICAWESERRRQWSCWVLPSRGRVGSPRGCVGSPRGRVGSPRGRSPGCVCTAACKPGRPRWNAGTPAEATTGRCVSTRPVSSGGNGLSSRVASNFLG